MKQPVESRPSLLLTKEENDLIFKLVGSRCQSLATAVVQLFTTKGPAHNQWYKKDTGILCLVKDNTKRSYFFRIYCMKRECMIWEHEVYNQIEYKSPRTFLHTFEAEDCMAAFNFASDEEAMAIKNSLVEKIETRKQRREERRQRSQHQSLRSPVEPNQGGFPAVDLMISQQRQVPLPHSIPLPTSHPQNGGIIPANIVKGIQSAYTPSSGRRNKENKKKITKADIGLPQDFKHVSHVGWDANKGFDIETLEPEEMKDFFNKAGVSESHLNDMNTRNFIYEFIQNHGGANAVKEDLSQELSALPVKHSNLAAVNHVLREQMAPPVPIRNPAAPVPPPMTKEINGNRSAPAPPARAPPPPPPPPQRLVQPSAPVVNIAAPPPPPPPPVPPMPMPVTASTPTPEVAPSMGNNVPDVRAALMDSIRSGKALKRVDTEVKKPVVEDKRGDLLSEIREGIVLRSVTTNAGEERKSAPQTGLAGALARALEERSKVMHSDSSEEDDDSDGDEWD